VNVELWGDNGGDKLGDNSLEVYCLPLPKPRDAGVRSPAMCGAVIRLDVQVLDCEEDARIASGGSGLRRAAFFAAPGRAGAQHQEGIGA